MKSMLNPDYAFPDHSGAGFHPTKAGVLRMHRYLPLAVCYFFFNHAGLPTGLFYTTIFSPFLFIWLYFQQQRWLTIKYLLVLSPFMVAHAILGIHDPVAYLRTLLHWWTAYIAVYAICWSLRKCASVGQLFDQLIVLNFCFALLALIIRPTPLCQLLWMDTLPIRGGPSVLRLNLFTHEPSAYAELMFPLLIYAVLRLLRNSTRRNLAYLGMIVLPVLLSQSFGGLSIGMAGIGVALLYGHRQLLRRTSSRILLLVLFMAIAALLFTPNTISQRVFQVINGDDGSAQGRTTFAFIAAYAVASSKSIWWGVGLGQMKLMDISYLRFGLTSGVPEAVAAIFAEFGLVAIFLILAVQGYLFFKTKVYRNTFRLAMFVVAFLQQVTGSYGTDVQEYVMWFLAFSTIFQEFNLSQMP